MPDLVVRPSSGALVQSLSDGRNSREARGGVLYELDAIRSLMERFEISVDEFSVRRDSETILPYLWRLRSKSSEPTAPLYLSQVLPLLAADRSNAARTIVVVHHLPDMREKPYGKFVFDAWLFRKLRQARRVIVVSNYWKERLLEKGITNITTIYNYVRAVDVRHSREELEAFRERVELPNDKPIVYLGPALASKGAPEAYQALREENFYFITTGFENQTSDLPVRFLSLDDADFFKLLAISSVVVANSKMIEGWNRIVHEAMAFGTPVVGSGTGGMGELLQGGGQLIAREPDEIRHAVSYCLENRDELGRRGRDFARKHTYNSFKTSWALLVDEALSEGGGRP